MKYVIVNSPSNIITERPAPLYNSTNPDWVPSVKMGYETYPTPDQERYTRMQLRKKRKMDAAEDVADDEDLDTGVACQKNIDVALVDVACQTYSGVFDVVKMEEVLWQLKKDNRHLQTEASEAKQQAERASFCIESLQNDEQKLIFYTGKLLLKFMS